MTDYISYQYERAADFFDDAEDFCESLCKLEEAVKSLKGDVSEGDAWKIRHLDVDQQRRADAFKEEINNIIDDPYHGTYKVTYFYPPGENVFFQSRFAVRDPRWLDVFEAVGQLANIMGRFSITVKPLLTANMQIDDPQLHQQMKSAMTASTQESSQQGFEALIAKAPQTFKPLKDKIEAFLAGRKSVVESAKELKKTVLDEEKDRRHGLTQIQEALDDIINHASDDPDMVFKGR